MEAILTCRFMSLWHNPRLDRSRFLMFVNRLDEKVTGFWGIGWNVVLGVEVIVL